MTAEPARTRLATSPFAVLGTHGTEGRLDLVPCCFAVIELDPSTAGEIVGSEVVTAVDHKPKRTTRLARLANIDRNPNASFLVDHRDPDDWSELWWVRVSGKARVLTGGDGWVRSIDALVEKYAAYQMKRPEGPVIRLTVENWASWEA